MNESIGENIRRFRIYCGYTQKELGNHMHRKCNSISNWETGITLPSINDVNILCKLFEITPNELFGWTECEKLTKWERENKKQEEELARLKMELQKTEKRIAEIEKLKKVSKNGCKYH